MVYMTNYFLQGNKAVYTHVNSFEYKSTRMQLHAVPRLVNIAGSASTAFAEQYYLRRYHAVLAAVLAAVWLFLQLSCAEH